jgi:hypothetical protein
MEKTKVLILLLLLTFAEASHAQNYGSAPFLRKGLMSISTGLTGGIMTFNELQEVYFTGTFSYCVEQQIGIRTDLCVFLPDYNFEGQLQKNSSILLGPEFHFPFSRFDLSFLFEAGVAFPYLKDGVANQKVQAEPVYVLTLGTSYYLFHNFHVFASAGYLHGNYFLENVDPFRLDEIRISAGLGVNIFVNHQEAFERKIPKF